MSNINNIYLTWHFYLLSFLLLMIGCAEPLETPCKDFLATGRESNIFLSKFKCEEKVKGISHLSFSGDLSFNYTIAKELENNSWSNQIAYFTNKKENIQIVVVDPILNPNIEIKVAKCEKPWNDKLDEGGNPIGHRCTLREFAEQESGTLLVANGGFFHYSYEHYKNIWNRTVQNYEIGDPVGLVKIGGKQLTEFPYLQQPFKKYWGFLSVRKDGDHPWIGNLTDKSDQVLLDDPFILSCAPILMRNRVLIPLNRLYSHSKEIWPAKKDAPGILKHIVKDAPRTAIGIDPQGRLYIFNVDGRMPGISEGMNMNEVAGVMTNLGVFNALALDGGASAGIFDAEKGEYLNLGLRAKERPIATAIVIKKRSPPYRIRKILNKTLLEQGAYPHKDYRIVDPKDIDNFIPAESDVMITSLGKTYASESKKYYLTKEEEKKIYRMKIDKNGIIINPNDNKPASGLGKYVYSREGDLYVAFLKKWEVYPTINPNGPLENNSLADPSDGISMVAPSQHELEFKHSYFLGGDQVVSGGWIEIQKGIVKCVDNHSGHYLPSWDFFKEFLRQMIYQHKVDFNKGFIYTYEVQHAPQFSLCWNMKLPGKSE